jgi:hypothetical protein
VGLLRPLAKNDWRQCLSESLPLYQPVYGARLLEGVAMANETRDAIAAATAAVVLAPLAVLAYRSGRAKRLWLGWAVASAAVLFAYAALPLLPPLPLSLPFFDLLWAPVPVFVTAVTVQVLGRRKAPQALQLIRSVLVFFLVLNMRMGTYTYDHTRPITSDWDAQPD